MTRWSDARIDLVGITNDEALTLLLHRAADIIVNFSISSEHAKSLVEGDCIDLTAAVETEWRQSEEEKHEDAGETSSHSNVEGYDLGKDRSGSDQSGRMGRPYLDV